MVTTKNRTYILAILLFICIGSFCQSIEQLNKDVNTLPDNSHIGTFSSGMAVIEQNNKYGYIDKSFKMVIPIMYDFEYPLLNDGKFSGQACAIKKGDKILLIDKKGKVILETSHLMMDTNGKGMFLFGMTQLYNDEGKLVKTFSSDETNLFLNENLILSYGGNNPGCSLFSISEKKSSDFDMVLYDEYMVDKSVGQYVLAIKKGKLGIVNDKLETIVPYVYESSHHLEIRNNLLIERENSNSDVCRVLSLSGDEILPWGEKHVEIRKNYIYTTDSKIINLYDHKGNKINFIPFGENQIKIENGEWRLYNSTGGLLSDTSYDYISDTYEDEICVACQGEKCHFLNSKGVYRTSFEFERNSIYANIQYAPFWNFKSENFGHIKTLYESLYQEELPWKWDKHIQFSEDDILNLSYFVSLNNDSLNYGIQLFDIYDKNGRLIYQKIGSDILEGFHDGILKLTIVNEDGVKYSIIDESKSYHNKSNHERLHKRKK